MTIKKTTRLAAAAVAMAGLLFAGTSKAQTATNPHDSQAWRFGIGVEPGIPTGPIRDFSGFSLGGNLRVQKDLPGPVSLMVTAGYTNFFAKSDMYYTADHKDYGLIPLTGGVKVFFVPHGYISGEAGAGFETQDDAYGQKNTKLVLSPGIGYAVSGAGLDLGLKYVNYSGGNTGHFGDVALRIAYGF